MLEGLWYMANIPGLRAVLKHDTMWSAWIQPLAMVYWPYSAFGDYSDLGYSLILKLIKMFAFPSSMYAQYPIITKQKLFFSNFCKCIKNKKLKCDIYISIQTLYSVLC